MDIGSIFLILGLFILVGLFISRPFLERTSVSVSQEEHEYSALLAERDRLLNALQELDFDNALGKVPEDDYPSQRSALLQRGAEVLRQLDTYQKEVPEGDLSAGMEDRLEAAIAARRADAARVNAAPQLQTVEGIPNSQGAADDDLEALLASRRRDRREKAAGFCSQCGGAVQKSDRFCPKCGNAVA